MKPRKMVLGKDNENKQTLIASTKLAPLVELNTDNMLLSTSIVLPIKLNKIKKSKIRRGWCPIKMNGIVLLINRSVAPNINDMIFFGSPRH